MSKYTTNFRELIEMNIVSREEIESVFKEYKLTDYLTDEEINVINNRGTWNKEKLAKKIVDNFYLREIGQETFAMFKHYAKIQMQKIMESKLPLIYSASIKYDPLVNVDFTETYNSESESKANASGLAVNSDTPQGQINKNEILQGKYATNTGATEQDTSNNDKSNYIKNVKGNSGVSATAQKMIEQYRSNIRAIDYEIMKELKPLFMGLF